MSKEKLKILKAILWLVEIALLIYMLMLFIDSEIIKGILVLIIWSGMGLFTFRVDELLIKKNNKDNEAKDSLSDANF